ncbi:hypothetical protein K458DRAFT_67481 [Lentithecium fluviatile CBS 122367]|uniref:Uncharacterized protein n=1 Tax=Lentithecium fluviatile CBS 122367 TaxID=1168545 RepID=A0A6G1JLT5_9PLEO|nr:hypothetical protein K458DRAFT_67481 [Lentithecium fluviatile CBS 122367]
MRLQREMLPYGAPHPMPKRGFSAERGRRSEPAALLAGRASTASRWRGRRTQGSM